MEAASISALRSVSSVSCAASGMRSRPEARLVPIELQQQLDVARPRDRAPRVRPSASTPAGSLLHVQGHHQHGVTGPGRPGVASSAGSSRPGTEVSRYSVSCRCSKRDARKGNCASSTPTQLVGAEAASRRLRHGQPVEALAGFIQQGQEGNIGTGGAPQGLQRGGEHASWVAADRFCRSTAALVHSDVQAQARRPCARAQMASPNTSVAVGSTGKTGRVEDIFPITSPNLRPVLQNVPGPATTGGTFRSSGNAPGFCHIQASEDICLNSLWQMGILGPGWSRSTR